MDADVKAYTTERVLPADSHMRIVENAGHFLQLEQPDAVARHIIDFVGPAVRRMRDMQRVSKVRAACF